MKYDLSTQSEDLNLTYHDPMQLPFSIHGVLTPTEQEDYYRRLPESVAEATSSGVYSLYRNTAGGRVRFRTDSPYVGIKAFLPKVNRMSHMAQTGTAGFAVYAREDEGRERHFGTCFPNDQEVYEGFIHFPDKKMREVTVYMPLYNDVTRFLVGLEKNSTIEKAEDYAVQQPVVFYGSSITQGGCASKPGADYEACLSRVLGFDYICLGFSGNAKGEQSMAEYIASLDMSVFVMDYDYNAPNPEHLQNTHEPFFKTIRKAHPDLPVIMISKPSPMRNAENRQRFEIIKTTYENAKAAGDENVYLIDGSGFFVDTPFDNPTVDGIHPTDYGFYLMAKGIEPTLRSILKK